MTSNTSQLPVPTFVWDSLMATMKAQSRRLVEDIAKTLGQEPGPLWKEISKQQFGVYLVDMNEPTNEIFQKRYRFRPSLGEGQIITSKDLARFSQ